MNDENGSTVISGRKIGSATRWALMGEIAAKLAAPLTNMILARLLLPEIFGIVAAINMVVSLSEIFSEAGFHLYLVQHEFKDEDELRAYSSSALWVSVLLSMTVYALIVLFRYPLAVYAGCVGYENTISVAALAIPVTATNSILMCQYRRALNYKPLFLRRMVGLFTPVLVTVPLALLGLDVWALVIGTLCGKLATLGVLFLNMDFRLRLSMRWEHLKVMMPFCLTTLLSYFASWLTNWIDVFISSNILGQYYTGLFKNSQSTVTGIVAIITASLTPILFSVLSRMQDDKPRFEKTMQEFTEKLSVFVWPIAFGFLTCSDLITKVLMGEKWMEASELIGVWGFCTCMSAIYATYCRSACRALGKPHLNVAVQVVSLLFIIPASYFGAKAGFGTMTYVRSLAMLTLIPAYYVVLWLFLKINPLQLVRVTLIPMLCAAVMGVFESFYQPLSDNMLIQLAGVPLGAAIYFAILLLFPSKRRVVLGMIPKKLRRMLHLKA